MISASGGDGYDVLIVGGGSAGAVLAARLSEDPDRSVLLIESGRDLRALDELPAKVRSSGASRAGATVSTESYLWTYDVQLVRGLRRAQQIRGRMLGGSTSVNGPNFARGIPDDYDNWGSDLWRFEAVLPYFRKLETDLDFDGAFHGSSGPVPVWRLRPGAMSPFNARFYEAALQAGIAEKPDLNHPHGEGVGPATRNDPGGRPMVTALAYLSPARVRRNLTIQTGVTARRVLFEQQRAVGIEAVCGGNVTVFRAREIVLSAGVFETPHLLLVSGIGPALELEALGIKVIQDLPGVGRNLRCTPNVKVPAGSAQDHGEPPVEAAKPEMFVIRTVRDRVDISLMPRQIDGQLSVQCQLRSPDSAGELHLVSADPTIPPSIDYGYLASDDLRRLRDAALLVRDLLDRPAFGRTHQRRDVTETSDRWIRDTMHTSYHACGTCRLGTGPDAVVDERCRVIGVDALKVVDASIMPMSVRAGPAATVVMLGERAAELQERAGRS